jgi:hypothetical protein
VIPYTWGLSPIATGQHQVITTQLCHGSIALQCNIGSRQCRDCVGNTHLSGVEVEVEVVSIATPRQHHHNALTNTTITRTIIAAPPQGDEPVDAMVKSLPTH